MDRESWMWSQVGIRGDHDHPDPGTIVRIARQAQGLTLAQLGERCGYSASQVSRYERGIQPLTDLVVLRLFAAALAIPPQLFGLLPSADPLPRHAASRATNTRACARKVGRTLEREDGADPVRRRELLAGMAGMAGATTLGQPQPAPAADPAAGLAQVLYGPLTAEPRPLATLRSAATKTRDAFQAARYDTLGAELPQLIAAATAAHDQARTADRSVAAALLADLYTVAGNLMIKRNDDTLAWAAADRACQAAAGSDDPLALADARRCVATVLRRTGQATTAHSLLISAADEIRPTRDASPTQLSMYGTLLAVAAYTAAVDGNRADAHELITEAAATAARLGHDANHRHTAFGPTNITLYQVSIAQVLGDNGRAIQHAATIHPAAIPTPERQGRYWIDVARAYHQWNRPEQCYHALLSAERAAPGEVRHRPPVRRMTLDLLHHNRRHALPGFHAFAARIGAVDRN